MFHQVRFSKWDHAVLVLTLAVVALLSVEAGNAACQFWCDDVIYYTSKEHAGDIYGNNYKVTTRADCNRIWHTDGGQQDEPITGGDANSEKAKMVYCSLGLTVNCYANGGVDGKCSTCAGTETYGSGLYDITCWDRCEAYPMP